VTSDTGRKFPTAAVTRLANPPRQLL